MKPEEEKRRLAWQCRRGMLELDALFQAFLEKKYEELDPALRHGFRRLLGEDDSRLFHWLLEAPEDAPVGYRRLVELIRRA
jgi:antitoxin CptB